MMIKRLIAFLLLIALCACTAFAEEVPPDSRYYIGLLAEAVASGSGDDAALDHVYAHFDALESSSLNLGVKLYIDILRAIKQNDSEKLKSYLLILQLSARFNAWLDENDFGLPNASSLTAYANGRMHEANGDYATALEAYQACGYDFDAAYRASQLIITDEAKYELACVYMADGRYAEALPLFEQLAESDYADSKALCSALREFLSTPEEHANEAKSGASQVCAHTKTAWRTTKQPGCSTQGRRAKVCAECGVTLDSDAIPAAGHKYEKVNTVAPTTGSGGYTVYKCEVCGHERRADFTDALPTAPPVHQTHAPAATPAPDPWFYDPPQDYDPWQGADDSDSWFYDP